MPSIRNKLADKKSKLSIESTSDNSHPASSDTNYTHGSFYNVPIEEIKPNPYQPRHFFDQTALEELTESVRQKGVIQPIIIRRDEDGTLFLVAGERRLKAAKGAGLSIIPAILTHGNPIEISLIENLQRENLKPLEEAEAFDRMINEFNYTQEQLAVVIGKGRTTVTQTLGLKRLPLSIRDRCLEADIPKRILVEIARKNTEQEMIDLFERVLSGELNSEQIREVARKRNRKQYTKKNSLTMALERITLLSTSLSKIDFSKTNADEKIILLQEIAQLKKQLEMLLSDWDGSD